MGEQTGFGNIVIVIGATGIDDLARPLNGMRAGASNPVRWQRFAGGVASNVARGISQHLRTQLITVTGDDAEGRTLVARLAESGIHVTAFSAPNCSTGRYTAVLDERGELFVGLSDHQSIELLTWQLIAERLPAQLLSDSTDASLHALVLDANLSQQCLADTLNNLPCQSTRVFALTVSPAKANRWLPVAAKVYALLCNRAEAATLASLPETLSLERLADGLVDVGFRQFVISDGGSSALVQEIERCEGIVTSLPETTQRSIQRHWVSVPKLPDGIETPITVNGAGDAMAAATIAHYVQQPMCSLTESLTISGMPAAIDILTGKRGPLSVV